MPVSVPLERIGKRSFFYGLNACNGWKADIRLQPCATAHDLEWKAVTHPRIEGSIMLANGPIILFDAECVLCSSNAQFVLTHDKRGYFRLASMQGEVGAALYRAHGMDPRNPISILVIEGDRVRRDSDAVLRIYEAIGYPWRLLGVLRLIPAALRDLVYRWVARNRYRLFGKRATCWVPPPEYRDRLL